MSTTKRKPSAKGKAGGGEEVDFEENLRSNVRKTFSSLGVAVPPAVAAATTPPDESPSVLELVLDAPVGGDAVRALCAALLGRGMGARAPAYKPLRALKLWRADCGDAGAAAVADVLLLGKDDLAPEAVDLAACGVGVAGCAALAQALMLGGNCGSLRSLRLDLTPGIGDAGVRALAAGLETCRSLTRLSLAYCGVGGDGAASLARVLASPLCALEAIELQGNALGADGLARLLLGVRASRTLRELNLSDNRIGARAAAAAQLPDASPPPPDAPAAPAAGTAVGVGDALAGVPFASVTRSTTAAGAADAAGMAAAAPSADPGAATVASAAAAAAPATTADALRALGELLADGACPLAHVDLDNNCLTDAEAAVLLPFVAPANTKVKVLRVDVTLSPPTFAALTRTGRAAPPKKKAAKK